MAIIARLAHEPAESQKQGSMRFQNYITHPPFCWLSAF
jgi:hypothetical protein